MHAAIASLAEGTPALLFSYQGKAEGLLRHFDAENFVLNVDELEDSEALTERILDALNFAKTDRQSIAAKVSLVVQMAANNTAPQIS